MIPMSAAASGIVRGSWTMHLRVESWRGSQLLADDVPVASGDEEIDGTAEIQERVTLTVPRRDRGENWDPTGDPDHPLAAFGQQLRISLGVELPNGLVEWTNRGAFVVWDTQTDTETVKVTATGLLTLIREAKLAVPFQPTGTFKSTVRDLVEPALTVVFDSTLVDRSVPSGLQWDDDRLDALYELLDAWPATCRMSNDGYLVVEPVVEPSVPVLSLTNGSGGTLVRATGGGTREGAYNVVVARGTGTDGGQVQGVSYDLESGSPFVYGGDFNPLPVPYIFESQLLVSAPQCRDAADAALARLRRKTAKVFDIECSPHPGLQVGDGVAVTTDTMTDQLCVVDQLVTPYSPAAQRLRVRQL